MYLPEEDLFFVQCLFDPVLNLLAPENVPEYTLKQSSAIDRNHLGHDIDRHFGPVGAEHRIFDWQNMFFP